VSTNRNINALQLPGFGPEVTDTVKLSQPFEVQSFEVEVLRSKRRKSTVGAQLIGGVLHITVPSWMSRAEEAEWVEKMSASFRRQLSTDRIDLRARALALSRRHDLPRPREIRWDDAMKALWATCTLDTGAIRISTRLAAFPNWVIDYVIVHELCHMEVAGHGPDFWQLVNRYPRAERAVGYLIAKSGERDGDEFADADFNAC
jgi:predicted metal-dependent hydrolase